MVTQIIVSKDELKLLLDVLGRTRQGEPKVVESLNRRCRRQLGMARKEGT